jgi:hypothetical protein
MMQTMTSELEQLIGKVVGDLGATANAALVIVGDRLGLYRALAESGPATSHELAERTGTHERYIREWLAAQAASGYVSYDPSAKRFSMSREQAMLFADENGPVYMAGGFFAAASAVNDEPHLTEAFRTGRGIPWSDHHDCLFCGVEKFFRPSYAGNLVQSWIPSLTDMQARTMRPRSSAPGGWRPNKTSPTYALRSRRRKTSLRWVETATTSSPSSTRCMIWATPAARLVACGRC